MAKKGIRGFLGYKNGGPSNLDVVEAIKAQLSNAQYSPSVVWYNGKKFESSKKSK